MIISKSINKVSQMLVLKISEVQNKSDSYVYGVSNSINMH